MVSHPVLLPGNPMMAEPGWLLVYSLSLSLHLSLLSPPPQFHSLYWVGGALLPPFSLLSLYLFTTTHTLHTSLLRSSKR